MNPGARGTTERSRTAPFPGDRDVVFTNYGITAFETIVRTESLAGATVALPAFICEVTFEDVFERHDLEPHFLDVHPDTFLLDREEAREHADGADVLLLVHAFGAPADGDTWRRFAEEHDVLLVEDCARALGATHDGRPVGSFGRYAIYSLRKVAPVARGGALVGDLAGVDLGLEPSTFDPRDLLPLVPDRVEDVLRRGVGRVASNDDLARDYTRAERLNRFNRFVFATYCRVRLPAVVERNRALAEGLLDAFDGTSVTPQDVPPGDLYHYLAATASSDRDGLVRRLREAGVPCEVLWDDPWAGSFEDVDLERDFPTAAHLADHAFQLPLYRMSASEARRAAEIVDEWSSRLDSGRG